jgi:transcriptional regulator with XRE-family HTH domain
MKSSKLPRSAGDTIIQAQREFIQTVMRDRALSANALASLAGLAGTTITRLLREDAVHALSSRTLAKIAVAAGTPIPAGVAATMTARLDRGVLWEAFHLAMQRVPQPLFGPRRWAVIVDVTALAYDFLMERREAGFDISNRSESMAAADFLVRDEIARRRDQKPEGD